MKAFVLFTLFAVVVITGCSKNETEVEPEVATDTGAAVKATSPQLEQQLETAVKKVQTSEYDEAIAALMKAQAAAKTEDERWEFRRMRLETQNALWEKAQTDPKAKEAYDNLAKLLLGR